MKTLILVRHAKSSWAEPGTTDFERPLNERGKRDAVAMAKRLRLKGISVDGVVSSPAYRAKATAFAFASELGVDPNTIIWQQALYLASPQIITATIQQTASAVSCLAVFCHNPGITELANMLTSVSVDNMPTCAQYAIQFDSEKWDDFGKAEAHFLFFDYPKSL